MKVICSVRFWIINRMQSDDAVTSVLFVCLGNICRSPLAEGIARSLAEQGGLDILIDSAGTSNWHANEHPCEHSVTIAANNGIDISQQRARQVSAEDFSAFDLIIALDQNNYDDLRAMGAVRLHKLGEFGYNNEDVPDPYFLPGFEGFDKVFEMIEACVTELFSVALPGGNGR